MILSSNESPPGIPLVLSSPDQRVRAEFALNPSGRLELRLWRDDRIVIEHAAIGIAVDGIDLGDGVRLRDTARRSIDETYPTRGWHATARDHARELSLCLEHHASAQSFTVEARAYDDGFAWRYIVPGATRRTVNGEASSWRMPPGTRVWFPERPNDWKLKSYAGYFIRCDIERLPAASTQGPIQLPPLVLESPGGGYAAITEAALYNYSGLRLRAIGHRTVQADFSEGPAGWTFAGEIVSPWRVVLLAANLDELVNTDVLTNLNPPPDPDLFADASFIRPGRATWRWWSKGTGSPAEELRIVDQAAELGFEYTLIDEGWEKWPDPWTTLAGLCAHARARSVGVLVWKDYKDISDPSASWSMLNDFLARCAGAGVRGVKIDFMNAESKDRIDFLQAAWLATARRRLVVLYHGCQKPGGETRTWPHELTREGIRGLELNKMREGPITAPHNAALPFTRFVAGHADYTPIGFSNPGDTTYAHQLATAIVFTSPLQVIAEHPEFLLRDPVARTVLDLVKALPTCWDETRVLPPSAIGRLALFARRSGRTWWIGAVNGLGEPQPLGRIDLSFLGHESYRTILVTSPDPRSLNRREISRVTRDHPLELTLDRVDGFVAVFVRETDWSTSAFTAGDAAGAHVDALI